MKRIFCFLAIIGGLSAGEIKPIDFSSLKKKMPKINSKLIDIHLTLYNGYVAQVNLIDSKINVEKDPFLLQSLRKQYGFEYDGMVLHELYFEQLGGKGELPKKQKLTYKILKEYLSIDRLKDLVKSYAKIRGVGWVILFGDIKNGDLKLSWVADHEKGLLAGWAPLCVIDLWEHAYIAQFGLDKSAYIDLIFEYMDWNVINKRYLKSCRTDLNSYVKVKR